MPNHDTNRPTAEHSGTPAPLARRSSRTVTNVWPLHGRLIARPVALCLAMFVALALPLVSSAAHAKRAARRDAKDRPGQLVAIPHFRNAGHPRGAAIRAAGSPSGTPSPPFRECPAIGADQSCGVLIYVTDSGATVLTDPSTGPYDGGDDTLVGVVNASGKAISSLSLSSDTDIFGFDGDGICTYSGWPAQPGCPYGPTGYEGPGTQLDGNGSDAGKVVFTNTLSPGGVAYFGLEDSPVKLTKQGYSALGDSYSSGEGTQDKHAQNYWYDAACQRGPDAWPILLGTDSNGSLLINGKGPNNSFFACSGATTADVLSSQLPELAKYVGSPSSPELGLVSVTVGGDDVKFAWVLEACYAGGIVDWFDPEVKTCTTALAAAIAYLTFKRRSFVNRLASTYSRIAQTAGPETKVEVAGYPQILPPPSSLLSAAYHCPWLIPDPEALVLASEMASDLNSDIEQAANQAGAGYASVEDAVSGHTLCTGDAWIGELSIHNRKTGIAGHPLLQGQEALASTVLGDMRNAGLPFAIRKDHSGQTPKPASTQSRRATIHPAAAHAFAESGAPLSVDASTAPEEATVGYPYVGYLTASGGTEPYKWSVTSGSLPEGLSLDAETGVISGEPTATGSATFTVTATDSASPTAATASAQVKIGSKTPTTLSVSTSAVPEGTAGQGYSATLQSNGGTNPVSWSIESGSLPAGLSLEPSGVIAGTPTAAGTQTVTLRATDGTELTAQTAKTTLKITVVPEAEPLKVTTGGIPSARLGAYYSAPLSSTGGTAPVSWSVTSGSLPNGMSLDANSGTISGVSTQSGSFPLTFTAADRATPTAHQASTSVTLTVEPGPALSILTMALPTATQGAQYVANLNAVGGVPGYSWYVREGSLPTGLSLNGSTGEIEGTPREAGTFSLSFTVQDDTTPSPQTTTQTVTLTIAASSPSIGFSPPAGAVGVPYEYTPSLAGGVAPYSWSVAGELPAGLTFDQSTGTIMGTPTAVGTTSITLRLTDSSLPSSQSAEAGGKLAISQAPALAIESTALPAAVAGQQYRAIVFASGGTVPFTWAIRAGSLPEGLSLETSTGVISGVPTSEGSHELAIQVSDSSSPSPQVRTATFTLAVGSPPELTIASSSLPEATAGTYYSQTVAATGGVTPYTWAVKSGSLPPGLSLSSSTGLISGTPTAAGEYGLVMEVADGRTPTADKATESLTLKVDPAAPLTLTSTSLSNPTQGVYYDEALDAQGGVGPYSWTVASGSLPTGLTLDQYTGEIYGEPRSYGQYSFTVNVSDSSTPEAESATVSYTIDVVTAEPFAVGTTSLTAGTQGQYYDQSLDISGGVGPYSISVVAGSLPTGLYIEQYGEIYGEITSSQSQTFTLRIEDQSSPVPQAITRQYTIEVSPAPPLEIASTAAKFVLGQYGYDVLDPTGGVPGYNYTVIASKLPAGLTFDYGEIYGSPTKLGKGSLEVKITDSATPTADTLTKTIGISVVKPGKLKFATTKLPNATDGAYYYQDIQLTGGSPGYTWTITAGSLPPGMYFYYGEVYGTPTEPGSYPFAIKVTDSGQPTPQTVTKTFKLKVLKQ
jgi:hypothetical protein